MINIFYICYTFMVTQYNLFHSKHRRYKRLPLVHQTRPRSWVRDLLEKARHVAHTLWTLNFQRKRPSNISFPIFHCIIPPDGAQTGGVMARRHLIADVTAKNGPFMFAER